MSDYTFFWDGPFSQWDPSDFELDGMEYNCAEQLMMAEKARLFGDDETLDQIMDSDDPSVQKKLGRLVQDFDQDTWEEDEDNGYPRCWNIVWRGNMAKFSQNPHLLQELLATGDSLLVEASPYDTIWGIGMRESDPGIQNPENWRGTNWLGEVLTVVRAFLKIDPHPYVSSQDSRVPGA
jgi:hypothetical protein